MADAAKELDDFETYLADVARQLVAMGAEQTTFYSDNGGTFEDADKYQGFYLDRRDDRTTERTDPGGPTYYLGGDWGHEIDFLGTDGRMYTHGFSGVDVLVDNEIVTTTKYTVRKRGIGGMVGKGKPFAQARHRLDNLLIKELAASRDR